MRTIKEVMEMKISELDLSVRCMNCMSRMNIQTLGELTKKSEEDIAKMRNVGKKSLDELSGKLADMELCYDMTDMDWLAWGLHHIEFIKSL